MRRLVIAFALGAVAFALAAAVAGLALGIAAQGGGWSSFDVSLGPLTFLRFERTPAGTATTFGGGLALVGLVGGALNTAGAALLLRLRDR